MADKRRPTPPPRSPKQGDTFRKGGGWQKPVKPPSQDSRPTGPPPKKSS